MFPRQQEIKSKPVKKMTSPIIIDEDLLAQSKVIIIPSVFSDSAKREINQQVDKAISTDVQPIENNCQSDGITPELIKKVAALKPLLDNGASKIDLKASSDDSPSKSALPLTSLNDVKSATAQIVLGPMHSQDPVYNALNFSAIQQQQKTPPSIKKAASKKN